MVDKRGAPTGFARKKNVETGKYYSFPVYGDAPPDLTEEYSRELQKVTGGKRFEDLPPYERARVGIHMEAVARRIRGEQKAEQVNLVRRSQFERRAMVTQADLQRNRELIEARRRRESVEAARPKGVRTKLRYNEEKKQYELVQV